MSYSEGCSSNCYTRVNRFQDFSPIIIDATLDTGTGGVSGRF